MLRRRVSDLAVAAARVIHVGLTAHLLQTFGCVHVCVCMCVCVHVHVCVLGTISGWMRDRWLSVYDEDTVDEAFVKPMLRVRPDMLEVWNCLLAGGVHLTCTRLLVVLPFA